MSDTLQLSHYLEAVARDLDDAAGREVARRRRRKPLRIAALVIACVVLVGGTALAGSRLLGEPASAPAQAALDAYYPDGGGALSPLEGHSQVVARFGDDVLYRSPARDGRSTCTSLTAVGDDGAREIPDSGCTADTGDRYWPIGLQVLGFHERQLIVGQVKAPSGASLFLVRSGEDDVPIPLGVDGFFLWELPQQSAPASIVLRDADGATLASRQLPSLVTVSASAP